jgi:hypothetical protein
MADRCRPTIPAADVEGAVQILDGRPTAGLGQLLKPFPVDCGRQRDQLRWQTPQYVPIASDIPAILGED